eukprot:CAMPEP_0182805790 /NCGR_PEP_ID=MMETSP0006_2-20121128/5254_1 /TAXON_ID=97485 /ORGANISM="Prymnesium parvum, Strain Texoma1" /LENGTH=60 /DNA_ID=CAMNT_0024931363 /DNA_START=826 /DNA_END=1005 /DNA_ORIENTATION=+
MIFRIDDVTVRQRDGTPKFQLTQNAPKLCCRISGSRRCGFSLPGRGSSVNTQPTVGTVWL